MNAKDLRRLKSRAKTILAKVEKLHDDMMECVGTDHALSNLTDNVLCESENLIADWDRTIATKQ